MINETTDMCLLGHSQYIIQILVRNLKSQSSSNQYVLHGVLIKSEIAETCIHKTLLKPFHIYRWELVETEHSSYIQGGGQEVDAKEYVSTTL